MTRAIVRIDLMPRPLPIPTCELVREYAARFDSDERYSVADRLLAHVFGQWPRNANLEEVLAKVVLLNGLYNTNVLAVLPMAKHILALDIDERLRLGIPAVVQCVATLTIRDRSRFHYSFATKYCSWHQSDLFPIYDAQVNRSLWAYQQTYKFGQPFRRPTLRDYATFTAVVDAFRSHFGLSSCTLRDIDKFLWLCGRNQEEVRRAG